MHLLFLAGTHALIAVHHSSPEPCMVTMTTQTKGSTSTIGRDYSENPLHKIDERSIHRDKRDAEKFASLLGMCKIIYHAREVILTP